MSKDRELHEIRQALHELQSRIGELEQQGNNDVTSQKAVSHCFELLDETGRTRLRLEISPDGQPCLALLDGNGARRASLSLAGNGCAQLFLTNLHESFPPPSKGGNNRSQIFLGFDDKGCAQLQMHDDPEASGSDPALSLAIRRSEWTGTGETKYHSKEASLMCDAWLGVRHDGKIFGARVVEPAPGGVGDILK